MTKSVLWKEKLISFCVINNFKILNFKRVNQKVDWSTVRNELKLYYYYYYYYYCHNIQEDIGKMAGTNS